MADKTKPKKKTGNGDTSIIKDAPMVKYGTNPSQVNKDKSE